MHMGTISHIYWIGGSSCGGKTTIAKNLAEKYGFFFYSCDQHMNDHLNRIPPEKNSMLRKISEMSMNDIFLSRPLEEQLAEYIEWFREDFNIILEDLLALPKTTCVVAEGNNLLPDLVGPLLNNKNHAIWLTPTEAFQVHHYTKRDLVSHAINQCDNPEKAFENWMKRDSLFARWIEESASEHQLHVFRIDGSTSVQENTTMVEHSLQLDSMENDRCL